LVQEHVELLKNNPDLRPLLYILEKMIVSDGLLDRDVMVGAEARQLIEDKPGKTTIKLGYQKLGWDEEIIRTDGQRKVVEEFDPEADSSDSTVEISGASFVVVKRSDLREIEDTAPSYTIYLKDPNALSYAQNLISAAEGIKGEFVHADRQVGEAHSTIQAHLILANK
jgi:hypothetical protein